MVYTNLLGLADWCGRRYEVSNIAADDFTVYVTDAIAADISIQEVTFENLAGVRQWGSRSLHPCAKLEP